MATANKNYNKEPNVWLLVTYTTGVIDLSNEKVSKRIRRKTITRRLNGIKS